MPYSIYEQQQQQLLANRIIFDENNPYGTTANQLRSNQQIYNETANQTTNQNSQSTLSTSQLNGQPPLPQPPNGLLMNSAVNGQSTSSASNPLLDQMSILNTTDNMNLNQQNALLNSSLTMPGATSTLNHPNLIVPQFAPTMLNNLDPNVRWRDPGIYSFFFKFKFRFN